MCIRDRNDGCAQRRSQLQGPAAEDGGADLPVGAGLHQVTMRTVWREPSPIPSDASVSWRWDPGSAPRTGEPVIGRAARCATGEDTQTYSRDNDADDHETELVSEPAVGLVEGLRRCVDQVEDDEGDRHGHDGGNDPHPYGA